MMIAIPASLGDISKTVALSRIDKTLDGRMSDT